jgi:hypothetical protein
MESQYNPDQSRDYEVRTFADGTYTAIQILDEIEGVITEFMRFVFTKYGFGVVKDEGKYNLDRFNPNFIVDKNEDLQFLIQLDDCPSIMQIFGLSASFYSLASTAGAGNVRIYFDFDLSETEYSNLEDRVSRDLLRIESGLTGLT